MHMFPMRVGRLIVSRVKLDACGIDDALSVLFCINQKMHLFVERCGNEEQ